MFHGDQWAAAFVNALDRDAGAAFACLKAMAPPVQAVRGMLFGRFAAKKLEKTLRESAAAAGFTGRAPEYTIRFISLLIEKNFFRHINALMEKIEKRLDEQRGILAVTLESAVSMDGGFEEELRRKIKEKTGAAEIKMKTSLVPELLGGYRLRIGGFQVDASLKGQLEKMTADLTAAAAVGGGI